jgi:cellobiose phosphorylase
MRHGHFDDEARADVLDRPDPPLPWINSIGCEDTLGLITQTGGGYTSSKEPRLRRLTRYPYNNVPPDGGGRLITLREVSEFAGRDGPRVWTPTWRPTRSPLSACQCRHRPGDPTIASTIAGSETSIGHEANASVIGHANPWPRSRLPLPASDTAEMAGRVLLEITGREM